MFFSNYYYLSLVIQAICVLHCIKFRKENKWIWLIVFLPFIGSIAYIFSEILTTRNVSNFSSDINTAINPGGSIRKLQEQLKFADTFHNRVALADAYLYKGQTENAIALYEQSLTGVFDENEHVIMQLIIAYAKMERYAVIIPLAKKLHRSPQFMRSQAHMHYAKALAFTGQTDVAEKEFLSMQGRFAHFEQRYEYGLFLKRSNRQEEANKVFSEMLTEAPHLSPRERRANRIWFDKARGEA